jgi:hypothetical protein
LRLGRETICPGIGIISFNTLNANNYDAFEKRSLMNISLLSFFTLLFLREWQSSNTTTNINGIFIFAKFLLFPNRNKVNTRSQHNISSFSSYRHLSSKVIHCLFGWILKLNVWISQLKIFHDWIVKIRFQ